jgi:hypothetical protein
MDGACMESTLTGIQPCATTSAVPSLTMVNTPSTCGKSSAVKVKGFAYFLGFTLLENLLLTGLTRMEISTSVRKMEVTYLPKYW